MSHIGESIEEDDMVKSRAIPSYRERRTDELQARGAYKVLGPPGCSRIRAKRSPTRDSHCPLHARTDYFQNQLDIKIDHKFDPISTSLYK